MTFDDLSYEKCNLCLFSGMNVELLQAVIAGSLQNSVSVKIVVLS